MHDLSNILIGPLQAKVMEYLWDTGESTVLAVLDHINGDRESEAPLAYTTVLTVMRNLARRKFVSQVKGERRAHLFKAMESRESYRRDLVQVIAKTYFNGALDEIVVAVNKLLLAKAG